MTTCNGQAYLRMQLDSILAQTLKPQEIIVCDDASTDDTIIILKEYADKGLIQLHQNTRRVGVLQNFKNAVSLCKTDNYITFSDQDDVWVDEKLQKQFNALLPLTDKPAIVFSDLVMVDQDLRTINESFWQVLNIDVRQENLNSLLFGNFITGCTVMMNPAMRDYFLQMPVTNVGMHDHWLGLIAYSFGEHTFLTDKLVRYRQHGNNVTFETNSKESLGKWLSKNIRQVINTKAYLKGEIAMVRRFYEQYHSLLTAEQTTIFKSFMSLDRAIYLRKKAAALASRSYRRNR